MQKYQLARDRIQGRKNIDIVVKCLAIYFVMMPFDSFPMFGMGSLLKAVAFLPLIAIILFKRRTKIIINKLTMAFMLYVFVNALSCVYSVDFSASASELSRLLMNGVLIIVVGGMYDEYNQDEVNYLIKALIIGGLATVALTLLFSDKSSADRLTLSINGVKQDHNYLNGYMYFAFAFFVNKLIGEKKLLYVIPSLLLIIFTLMTGSRGSTVSLMALGIMVFVYNMFNTGKIKFSVMIIAFIVLIVFIFSFDYIMSLLPSDVAARFSSDYIQNYKGLNRNVLWGKILKIYNEGPFLRKLFGYGYGTVSTVNTFNNEVSHNLWLDHLISGGVIGVIVLTYMHIVFVVEVWRLKNPVIFSAYIGYLTMCMTLSIANYKPLWNCMMMIMILMVSRMNEAEPDTQNRVWKSFDG